MIFRITLFLLLWLPLIGLGQQTTISGNIFDESGTPLPYATAVLLDPADSTLQFYGISNQDGRFEIKQVKPGNYLLQIAFMGFETFYKTMQIPGENSNLGVIALKQKKLNLEGVDIVGERIPIRIKKDTLEFDADAFKTRPDAVAEDLLKKLPGVEVDRAGNIKALGEDVREVMVDGKEFFGSDPKVATKNLPADALDKVQVIDKKSEEAEFTGMDDGQRNKAVNLVLKDDRKNGVFGDVEAGYGTDDHYKGATKVYRFSDKTQFAALGMLNNINQYGFSFNDYLNFGGGISSITGSGGAITIGSGGDLPINFGQPVSGLTTSGAGGLNFSISPKKHNRTYISYLVNGYEKDLEEKSTTQNFTPEGIYNQLTRSNNRERQFTHSVNFGIRRRIDSTQNLMINGQLSLAYGKNPGETFSESYVNDTLVNALIQKSGFKSQSLNSRIGGSYHKKFNQNRSVFKSNFSLKYSDAGTDRLIDNTTKYYLPPSENINSQYQNDATDKLAVTGGISLLQSLSGNLILVPGLKAGIETEAFNREYGVPSNPEIIIDSLSPDFSNKHHWITPEIRLRRTVEKSTFSAGFGLQTGETGNRLWDDEKVKYNYTALLPAITWEYDYRTTRRLSAYYQTSVNAPSVELLQPTGSYMNPLHIRTGNRYLEPEKVHNLVFQWMIFDQFSSTSFFMNASGTWVKNKINWERSINDQLVQTIRPVNVPDDYSASGGIDFSTPVRKLGLRINVKANESYNRGINIINGVKNINTNLNHRLSLRFDNRKKEKWDVSTGVSAGITNSRYSVQESLDNNYFEYSWFADISFTPNESWHFSASADITSYSADSFDNPVEIPLISGQISHYMLKNKRGVLSLQVFDLLDKNTNLVRTGEMNYLVERQTNSIGRYVMLSFKYRLNKFGNQGGGVSVEFDKL